MSIAIGTHFDRFVSIVVVSYREKNQYNRKSVHQFRLDEFFILFLLLLIRWSFLLFICFCTTYYFYCGALFFNFPWIMCVHTLKEMNLTKLFVWYALLCLYARRVYSNRFITTKILIISVFFHKTYQSFHFFYVFQPNPLQIDIFYKILFSYPWLGLLSNKTKLKKKFLQAKSDYHFKVNIILTQSPAFVFLFIRMIFAIIFMVLNENETIKHVRNECFLFLSIHTR